jgi:beta-lactamase class A
VIPDETGRAGDERFFLFHSELWVEKAALAGVLRPIACDFHATLMVNKGYSSATAMHDAYERLSRQQGRERRIIFYLGNHDPSSEDMVRDIRDRLVEFGLSGIEVVKIGLTMEQVEEHKPPPNPAKMSDSRANKYVEEHGNQSWEVDALTFELPIMAAVYEAQTKGQVTLDEILPLQRRLKAPGSGHLKFQRNGTLLTVRQLIYKMITESDNTATNMLTDMLGMGYYNSEFMRLGLLHTNFSRMIMDLRKRDRGIENYTTARDMAVILEKIYNGELTGSDEMIAVLKDQKVKDRIPVAIPVGWQVGHKTVLLRNTVHDVGIVFAPTSDYILCVLTSNVRNIRRAKGFIAEIAHQTAVYYSDPRLHYLREDKKPFWTKAWRRRAGKSYSSDFLPGSMPSDRKS